MAIQKQVCPSLWMTFAAIGDADTRKRITNCRKWKQRKTFNMD